MKYNILVSGQAHTDYPYIKELDNVKCEDNFADYFSENAPYSDAIVEGYMSFKVVDNKLYTQTLYKSKRKLTKKELVDLAEYTQGQWSDGIGEGFEQNPLFKSNKWEDDDGYNEVYISAWFKDQVLVVDQTKID